MHLATCCTRVRDLCQCTCVRSLLSIYTIYFDSGIGVRRLSDSTQLYISLHGVRGGISRPKSKKQPDRKGYNKAGGHYTLPPPAQLEIHSNRAWKKWKGFKRAWDSYALATGLNEKAEDVQVSMLLTVIGEEAREVYSTLNGWENAEDGKKIAPVLQQF